MVDRTLLFETYSKEKAIDKIIAVEDGYVNNPNDRGRETNYGVTVRVAKKFSRLWDKYNWDGDMKTMPLAFAREVYAIDYWDSLELDTVIELHPLLADALFDAGVNAGVSRASEWLQRLLNVNNDKQKHYKDIVVDGDIGPATMRALKSYYNVRGDRGIRVLLAGFLCLKGNHYIECSEKREKNETFTYGWLDHRIFNDMNTYMDLID